MHRQNLTNHSHRRTNHQRTLPKQYATHTICRQPTRLIRTNNRIYFLYGIDPPTDYNKLHTIDKRTFPNAHKMACQAFSTKTPSNILKRADQISNSKPNKYNYGDHTKAPPQAHTTHRCSVEKSALPMAQLDSQQ